MFKKYFRFFGGSLLIVGVIAISWNVVKADVTSCSASVTPHTVSPNTSANFTIQINNTDTVPITWVRITRPSSDFSITSNSSPGWQSITSSRYAFQTDGTLNPGQSMTVTLTANIGASEAASANWIVHTSEVPGINIFSCSGNLGTAISGASSDSTPPSISNINVSDISSSSVKISWTTDEPATSEVVYGLTTGYGQTSGTNSNLSTNHSVDLTGLNPATGYHFQVRSIDENNNTGMSSNNTFLTASAQPTGTGTGGGGDSGGSQTDNNISTPKAKIPIKEEPTESEPPKINFVTDFSKPFDATPQISGTVTDNEAVAGIEYSIDGGFNWLPVDSDNGLGSKEAKFLFKPLNLEDGDYKILVRAVDTSGNVGISDTKILIIDRLPPIVGGSVLSLGPHTLQPDDKGIIYSVTGVDQKITLSSIGGATSIRAVAKSLDGKKNNENFSLTQTQDTGLWAGIISFKNSGEYSLYVEAEDGAGNKTSRVINNLFIAPAPQLVAYNNEPISAKIEVFYLETESNSWTLWEGNSYGQPNPQTSDDLGDFKLFLPEGKFYIEATAPGYKKLVTDIFEINRPKPISTILHMEKSIGFAFGRVNISLPLWNTDVVDTSLVSDVSHFPKNKALEASLVDTNFGISSDDKLVNSVDFLGRPTLITLINTWSPDSSRQVTVLSELQKNSDLNILPVFLQERKGRIQAFKAISDLEFKWASDPYGQFASSIEAGSVPVHYFVDRKGNIKDIKYGFIDYKTTENILGGL